MRVFYEAEVEPVLNHEPSAATFTAGQAINDGTAYGTVKTWDSTTRIPTVENISNGSIRNEPPFGTTYIL